MTHKMTATVATASLLITLVGGAWSSSSERGLSGTNCAYDSSNSAGICAVALTVDPSTQQGADLTVIVTYRDAANEMSVASAIGNEVALSPDLSTSVAITSSTYSSATVRATVTNLDSNSSAPTTMTINVQPTQSFSYKAGAGTDCTASTVPGSVPSSQFQCPVPSIAPTAKYTRDVQVQNLSNQGPRYVQVSVTTNLPGDTNSSNNRAGTTLTLH